KPHPRPWIVEAALCRQWGCHSVLTRQSGGLNENHWHKVCEALNLQLLLIARPQGEGLSLDEVLTKIGIFKEDQA
ncbi:precorrin-6A/cobalt-precorrin-6A reductase, partial [Synechococcus lacustris]|uniref:precorrin-6A/cobalt-precorrin-6A reductase n=1 Tax=Synechococcus lacustris TaxID=2116544 RepID=UPI00333E6342